jgi:hypothetical protein
MMKIAVCLHGIAKGMNDRGVGVSFEDAIPSIQSLTQGHDVDFFVHSWSTSEEETIKSACNPIEAEYEDQITFNHPFTADRMDIPFDPSIQTRLQSLYSRWYSYAKSVSLKSQQEKKTGQAYDFVLSTRFDIIYKNAVLPFDDLKTNRVYLSHWDHNMFRFGYNDTWFLAGSPETDKIAGIYGKLNNDIEAGSEYDLYTKGLSQIAPGEPPNDSCRVSSHGLLRWQIHREQITPMFLGLEYATWTLVRKKGMGNLHPRFSRGFRFPLDHPVPEDEACKNLTGPVGAP